MSGASTIWPEPAIRYDKAITRNQEAYLAEHKVWIFFYGSYMNLEVLKEADLFPDKIEVARLSGFDLDIAPRANLIPSGEKSVYGILTRTTHREMGRLYTEHAHGLLGELYLPEAVLVQTLDGRFQPAMTYICWSMTPKAPENDYIHRILRPARDLNFPAWYVDRIASFLR